MFTQIHPYIYIGPRFHHATYQVSSSKIDRSNDLICLSYAMLGDPYGGADSIYRVNCFKDNFVILYLGNKSLDQLIKYINYWTPG